MKFIILCNRKITDNNIDIVISNAIKQSYHQARQAISEYVDQFDLDDEDILVLNLDDIADVMNCYDHRCGLTDYENYRLFVSENGVENRKIYCLDCRLLHNSDLLREYDELTALNVEDWIKVKRAEYEMFHQDDRSLAEEPICYLTYTFEQIVTDISSLTNGAMDVFGITDNTAQSVK